MSLTLGQRDSLAELINLGFGQAASSLSQLTGQAVSLRPPQVQLTALSGIVAELTAMLPGDVACVDQPFSGLIAGDGLLLMEQCAAVRLARILGLEAENPKDRNTQEALTEVGNIVLNACLGVFDRVFGISVVFAVPTTRVLAVEDLFRLLTADLAISDHALLVQTHVRLSKDAVTAYMVIMPRSSSIDRLLVELGLWESRQNR